VISAPLDRRRRALAWSTVVSLLMHAVLLGVLFALVARRFVPQGSPENVSQVTVASIERFATPKPAPVQRVHHRSVTIVTPAQTAHRELAKVEPHAAPQPPHPLTLKERLQRDRAQFGREVAQLNSGNDPHAIATIDPGSQESSTKTYAFQIPSSLRGQEHGNGFITPTTSWKDHGLDCYYGHYDYTYPDGAEESGAIAWPFCYDPGLDPFKEPPHPMPFPPPLVGYVLPPGTYLPPLEKDFYDHWIER